ncbi:hypothetical protein G7046_g9400 [Stylonectria norvegica]|nr:hypothetical protein G7046_g9400 [Stylonectria norvegica]
MTTSTEPRSHISIRPQKPAASGGASLLAAVARNGEHCVCVPAARMGGFLRAPSCPPTCRAASNQRKQFTQFTSPIDARHPPRSCIHLTAELTACGGGLKSSCGFGPASGRWVNSLARFPRQHPLGPMREVRRQSIREQVTTCLCGGLNQNGWKPWKPGQRSVAETRRRDPSQRPVAESREARASTTEVDDSKESPRAPHGPIHGQSVARHPSSVVFYRLPSVTRIVAKQLGLPSFAHISPPFRAHQTRSPVSTLRIPSPASRLRSSVIVPVSSLPHPKLPRQAELSPCKISPLLALLAFGRVRIFSSPLFRPPPSVMYAARLARLRLTIVCVSQPRLL